MRFPSPDPAETDTQLRHLAHQAGAGVWQPTLLCRALPCTRLHPEWSLESAQPVSVVSRFVSCKSVMVGVVLLQAAAWESVGYCPLWMVVL